jgi:ketosteroid isomerase-like protein
MSKIVLSSFAILAFALVVFSQDKKQSPALNSLVEAERAFARMGAEKGVRDSFIAYFAEDGINFTPHPVKTRETLGKRPAEPANRPTILNWEPIYGDLSRAADLGYTTGPYWVTENKPGGKIIGQGFFFSVWKKQSDGQWKVVVDLGTTTPEPLSRLAPLTFEAARQVKIKGVKPSGDIDAQRKALMEVDREFLSATVSSQAFQAYRKYLSDDARLHRNGAMPLIGEDAIAYFLSKNNFSLTGEPIKSDVAESNDLGYTVGRYEMKKGGAVDAQKGYYVRVWKRDEGGRWKVVVEVSNVIPPESKSSPGE